MFLWTRSITTQILKALFANEQPGLTLEELKTELIWNVCLVLPLAVIVGQLYVRISASFGLPKAVRKLCPPAIYTTLVQLVLADAILAVLLQSVVLGRLDLTTIDLPDKVDFKNWNWNAPFTVFVIRFILTALGLAVGEAFFPLVLTGGIACGKSTFAKILQEEFGCKMIDADKIGHLILLPPWHKALYEAGALVGPKDSVYVKILETFQDDNSNQATNGVNQDHPLLAEDKTIDRAKLGARIFGNPDDRRKLNSITHGRIFWCLIKNMTKAIYLSNAEYVCAEVPLLFESGALRYIFGAVLCVACTPSQQLERLMVRNPELSKEECQKRIDSQMPMKKKVELADLVLWNDKDYSGNKKESDADKEIRQKNQQNAMREQVKKALMRLLYRRMGVMGLSLTRLVVLMSGSLVVSTCFQLW